MELSDYVKKTKTIYKNLGSPKFEIDSQRKERINERTQKIENLEKKISERSSERYEDKDKEEIENRNQQDKSEIDNLKQQNLEDQREQIIEDNQISLRTRIKLFLKRYGFTISAIFLSLSAIISSLILNLTSGLKNILNKVGNGLKDIGKKLANLLPGMIGTIPISFSKQLEKLLDVWPKMLGY